LKKRNTFFQIFLKKILKGKNEGKYCVNAVTSRRYNPSVFLRPKGAKIQLPFNKERSSVIYRGKGGNAACVWRKAPNTNVYAAKRRKHLA